MSWPDLRALLEAVMHEPAFLLVLALIGLAAGTALACCAQEPGDRYADADDERGDTQADWPNWSGQ